MDTAERLRIFIQHTAQPYSQFADNADIPRPTLSQIINGRNKKISNEVFAKLHDAFPELNMMWLMFGEGPMTTGDSGPTRVERTNDSPTPIASGSRQAVVPHQATSGCASGQPAATQSLFDGPEPKPDRMPSDDAEQSVHDSEDAAMYGNMNNMNNMNTAFTPPSQPDCSYTAPNSQSRSTTAKVARQVSYIMVFYTDNSFEVFRPDSL